MKKTIYSLVALAMLALFGTAQAYPVKLVEYVQYSGTTKSVLRWDGCTDYSQFSPCIKPGTSMGTRVTPSTAVWDWNPATGVLSSTGDFNAASSISSQAAGPMVIGDSVTNLTLNTTTSQTLATAYRCIEGTFLSTVGANGCLNTSTGDDFTDDSSAIYNFGGDPTCVKITIGGDDSAMEGNPRGLINRAASGDCAATDGAFNMWTVFQDNTGTGGQLIIASGPDITAADSSHLTFDALPHAVDDAASVQPTVAKDIDVLANDLALTDPVTVVIGTAPTKGTATVVGSPGNKADVHITYTANAGTGGDSDSFTYSVTSGTTTSTATVDVTILNVGANPDTGTTTRNKPVTINVGANDTGFTGNVTVSQVGSCDKGGSFTPGAAGPAASASITYTPVSTAGTPTYTEVCTYQITDGTLTGSSTITVTVNNTVPVAGAGAITISTKGVDPSTKSQALNVASISGNSLGNTPSTVTTTAPGKGSVTVSGSTVTYTPNANFYSGTDTFDYTITDSDPGTPETATGTITVTIANETPALAAVSVTTTADLASPPKALAVTLGNGSLAQHTLSVTTQGAGGSCAVNSAGTAVTYTPNAGFSGADSCVITVTDGDGSTGTGTVSVTVNAGSSGGGGGGPGNVLPAGKGSMDLLSLALLGGAGAWFRRKRKAA